MSSKPSRGDGSKKRCFVVMGFGEKVDFQTGRRLNLDASYHNMIKPAVEEAGLECFRAADFASPGSIAMEIYKQLLTADLVIADLSTYNPNVFYELGVRHALRPFTTILIAEDKLTYPFDAGFMVIRRYQHLGEDISVSEARRFGKELGGAIKELMSNPQVDSPVHLFLDGLRPPLQGAAPSATLAVEPDPKSQQLAALTQKLASLADELEKAVADEKNRKAGPLLDAAVELLDEEVDGESFTPPPALILRLVRAAAEVSGAGRGGALERARQLLEGLSPTDSTDPETLELLGDIEFALFEHGGQVSRLARAREAYEKLHALSPGQRSGIILAYAVSLHAQHRKDFDGQIFDVLMARRLWREAVKLGDERLAQIKDRYRPKNRLTSDASKPAALRKSEAAVAKLSVLDSMAEAYFGLRDEENLEAVLTDASLLPGGRASVEAIKQRIKRLEPLVERQSVLLSALEPADGVPHTHAKPPKPGAGKTGKAEEEREGAEEAGPAQPGLVFFSYTHKSDLEILDQIKNHLVTTAEKLNLHLWDDREILKGAEWDVEIKRAMSRAVAAVLLVNADFLAREYTRKTELPTLLRRREEEGILLMWVATGPVVYQDSKLSDLQGIGNPDVPLMEYEGKALSQKIRDVSMEIRKALVEKFKPAQSRTS
jgi:hypothetical protein